MHKPQLASPAEQLCKAGLALAIDKQPRGIKVTSGKKQSAYSTGFERWQ
ncbi:hypothetical protein O9993_06215 [Vibrio lentus]|nr:hypothetical protein [Vibrio lentus]